MRSSHVFPSNFLRASDLIGRKVTVRIRACALRDVGDDDQKPVLFFAGKEKGLVLNRTNWQSIADLYGDESDAWVNQPITLYPTKVQFRSKMVDAIRIEAPTFDNAGALNPGGFVTGLPDTGQQAVPAAQPQQYQPQQYAQHTTPTVQTGDPNAPPPNPGPALGTYRRDDLDDEIPF